jgi:indole-3-glycerol phosphate synthase
MTQTVLEEINARKAQHVAAMKAENSLADLKARIKNAPAPLGFINAIKAQQGTALISEVKKASPSKGLIRADFDPVNIATIYKESGAACLSVLTDEPYFQGHDDYFKAVKAHVDLPALRKEFMIEPYQIFESRALGADCILVIMASLSDSMAKEIYDCAVDLGMDVLVEIHDLEELERAKALKPEMIGVNNRNLKTLDVDIQTSFDLLEHIPDNVVKVAESGISQADTIQSLSANGYNAFLVGESLMRQDDIEAAVKNLLK